MDELDFSSFIQKASKFLKQRDRTSNEVRSFFISKGYDSIQVEQVIHYMQKIGLINDEKFINQFVENYIKKGFGKLAIAEKLKRFGFSETEILEKLNAIPKSIWTSKCEQLISHSRKNYPQVFQNLLSRGFEKEEVERAFQNLNISILRDEFYESV